MHRGLRRAAMFVALSASTAGGAIACNQLIGIEGGHARPLPIQVAAGSAFACALLSDGTVWCWGADDYKQLGHLPASGDRTCTIPHDGGSTVYLCNPTPTQVGSLTGVTQIALGNDFACALRGDGTVWCWGNNGSEQLGGAQSQSFYMRCPVDFFDAGTASWSACNPLPQRVKGMPSATGIAAGAAHACAETASGVFCWGNNQFTQLGMSTSMAAPGGPLHVPLKEAVASLSAPLGDVNGSFTCGATQGGRAECWGNQATYGNPPMQGCGTQEPCSIPVSGARSVLTGSGYACAVGSSEELTCWGQNQGTFVVSSGGTTPVKSQYADYLMTDNGAVPQLVDGRYLHVLAVDQRGGLWGWGSNNFGELGPVSKSDLSTCPYGGAATTACATLPVSISVPSDAGVSLVSAAQYFSVAMTKDGVVWAWGANSEGQLGHLSTKPTPCSLSMLGDIPCETAPSVVTIPVP